MQRGAYGTVEMQFTLENIARVFDPLYMGTLWETVKIAVITTVICLLIGYPFAYTITIVDRKYRSILYYWQRSRFGLTSLFVHTHGLLFYVHKVL